MVAAAKKHKLGIGIGSVMVVLLVAAAGYGIYDPVSRSKPAPFQNFTVSKATESGNASLVAISPDGKYLLHTMTDAGQQSLWLQNIPTNSNTQVVAPALCATRDSASRRTAITCISPATRRAARL